MHGSLRDRDIYIYLFIYLYITKDTGNSIFYYRFLDMFKFVNFKRSINCPFEYTRKQCTCIMHAVPIAIHLSKVVIS